MVFCYKHPVHGCFHRKSLEVKLEITESLWCCSGSQMENGVCTMHTGARRHWELQKRKMSHDTRSVLPLECNEWSTSTYLSCRPRGYFHISLRILRWWQAQSPCAMFSLATILLMPSTGLDRPQVPFLKLSLRPTRIRIESTSFSAASSCPGGCGSGPVVLKLFDISYPLLSNKITRFYPNTLNGACFWKIWK